MDLIKTICTQVQGNQQLLQRLLLNTNIKYGCKKTRGFCK